MISKAAFAAAVQFMTEYVLPNAERVYHGVGLSPVDRNATTLAKWIVKTVAQTVHVRTLLREVRLSGLASAETIHDAAHILVDLGWLCSPEKGKTFGKRGSMEYAVNPAVHT